MRVLSGIRNLNGTAASSVRNQPPTFTSAAVRLCSSMKSTRGGSVWVRVSLMTTAGVTGPESGRVPPENPKLAGRDPGAVGEGEIDSLAGDSAQVERFGTDVLELDELELVPRSDTDAGRVVHDLGKDQAAEVLGGI